MLVVYLVLTPSIGSSQSISLLMKLRSLYKDNTSCLVPLASFSLPIQAEIYTVRHKKHTKIFLS